MKRTLHFSRTGLSIAVLACGIVTHLTAHADTTVLNSFIEPGDRSNGASAIVWETGYVNLIQKLGVEFSIGAPTEITTITAAIFGTGTFNVGIQSGLGNTQGTYYPSSSFIYKATMTDPVVVFGNTQTNPSLDVSPLHWDLAPGVYFLVAESAALNTASGYWGYGTGAHGVVSVQNSPWFDAPTFAARINGIPLVAAVPEPGTWLMMGMGLGVLGWNARRRSEKSLGA